ncbi:hypothetical protein HHI36_006290 [Cryptolaemus montrouzieri]|uniref:Uncharacterized protein n=1 Tax=Cryptolaemus montrouzieri TaxID=559131 RepID=A0ABD2NXR2_9CUCU
MVLNQKLPFIFKIYQSINGRDPTQSTNVYLARETWIKNCYESLVPPEKRMIRQMACLNYRDRCETSFEALEILTVPWCPILVCLFYEIIDVLSYNSDFHAYNTRFQDDIHIPCYRLNRLQRGPEYSAFKLCNKLANKVIVLPISEV